MDVRQNEQRFKMIIQYAYSEIPKIVLDYLNQKLPDQRFFPMYCSKANMLLNQLGLINGKNITYQQKVEMLEPLLREYVINKIGGAHLQTALGDIYQVVNSTKSLNSTNFYQTPNSSINKT
ncbi:hypothetical protein [Aquicella lusitana]|uniref:Uncharacterized protein n=1 Tax=Aquicella lusitana TaxID=254246 RepID=A0A370GS77_9COXI|nr:hypothetical protein [Aquicella lusitana]RDI46552.1 hypothetical protein C8D86_10576 [Aquicella lusitana]VVC74216.1 hypothetical protein AQULUS_19810 [Aquicella lusitana]